MDFARVSHLTLELRQSRLTLIFRSLRQTQVAELVLKFSHEQACRRSSTGVGLSRPWPTSTSSICSRRRASATKQLDLSGLLLYDRGFFFQWIEGPDAPLGQVWNSIRRDVRHTDVCVFADQAIPTRLFDAWKMRFAHRGRQHDAMVEGFSVVNAGVLDDLHLNPAKTPNILATFSKPSAARQPLR